MTCTFFDPDENLESIEENPADFVIDDTSGSTEWDRDLEQQVKTEDNIKLLEDDRKDVQRANESLLSLSGLLLTGTLAALYFSYNKDSSNIPWTTTILLFTSSILISWSIFKTLGSLRLKARKPLVKEELENALREVHDEEYEITNSAIDLLKYAIGALILGLILLALNVIIFYLLGQIFIILRYQYQFG
jgi:hypothetical protein